MMNKAGFVRLIVVSSCVAFATTIDSSAQTLAARQVAAPASDIVSGLVRLPDPSSTPTTSCAAALPLRFTREANSGWSAELRVPVERRGAVTLAILSADAGNLRVEVGANGALVRPIADAFALERRTGFASDALPGWIIDRYDMIDAPAGTWTVRVRSDDPSGAHPPLPGWLALTSDHDLRIEAHVTTQRLLADEPIGIVASLSNASHGARIEDARLVLEHDGRTESIAMQDDGRHEDGARGDGVFGALVPESASGQVVARVEIHGSTADGASFLRTTQLAFPVLERAVLFDGSARTRLDDEQHLRIEIGALPLTAAHRFHVSAEVWGRASDDRSVPICWLSREAEIEASAVSGGKASSEASDNSSSTTGNSSTKENGDSSASSEHGRASNEGSGSANAGSRPASSSTAQRTSGPLLALELDTRWLDATNAHAPLELRQVRVQDPDTDVVFDLVDRMTLDVRDLPASTTSGPQAITSEMLTGSSMMLQTTSPTGPSTHTSPILLRPALMLVHGYCSSGSIWPAADFAQPKLEFLDPNANRTNDQFAQLINAQAQAAGLTSFGVVTHSQGGCAALHLLTYYTSGLDFSIGGRRIQALAAPFQGTPLASLGSFACGVNNDMTLAGAATWLAGIPTWARAEVYYWTTSDAGTPCNFLTHLFLTDPEDGTVEEIHGQLPSGNNMGHTTGWCHTTGMSYPASYTDHTRNQAMNAAAAR